VASKVVLVAIVGWSFVHFNKVVHMLCTHPRYPTVTTVNERYQLRRDMRN
jgi:hypothetical protein